MVIIPDLTSTTSIGIAATGGSTVRRFDGSVNP